MCTDIIEHAAIAGSAKRPKGWPRVDTANVYYGHPYHAPYDHTLNIDFLIGAGGPSGRVAVELTAEAARSLVRTIQAALASGEAAHALNVAPASAPAAH